MQRYNFAGTPTTELGRPMPSMLPYRNSGSYAALPQARSTVFAPMNKAPVKCPSKPRPSTDDEESESDGEDSGSNDDTSVRKALVKAPIRNDSVRSARVLRSSVTPLDRSHFQTRFLSILPSRSAEVSCTLTIGSLIRTPAYVALSYHWGDQTSTRPISLDGRSEQVTASLEAALQALRARNIPVVWVDALCICQRDPYEKVYQLSLMGGIFSKAAKVVAWLGPAADDSSNALQALANMQYSNRLGSAITSLLQRPYWTRAWIIQELAKASKAEVWCGPQVLPWDVFVRGVQGWWAYSKIRVGDFDHPIMVLQYFRNAEADVKKGAARMLLSAAMVRSLDTKASLDRDRIYALLGIARDGRETMPTPHYMGEDAVVFDTVLKQMIIEQGQLNLIFLAGTKRARGIPPSWLPRWNDTPPLQASPWLVRCFEYIGPTNNIVECEDDITLKVTGQILGRLQVTTTSVLAKLPSQAMAIDLLRATAWQLLKCRWNDHCLETVPGSAYELAAIWSPYSPSVYAKFPKLRQWYEWHADTSFAGLTLRASIATLSKHPQTLHAAQLILKGYRYKAFHWLDHLELAASTMSRHRMSLRMMNHLGVSQMIMVPHSAKENHFVARLRGCSLPVVICGTSGNKYSVIGEVVEIDGWAAPKSRKAGSEDEDGTDSDGDEDEDEDDEDDDDVHTYSDEGEDDDPAGGETNAKQLCANDLNWGTGYVLGSGRALGGDWRHVSRAHWVRMYLV
ncbi:hypothetical protein Q7P35_002696 [Cladosporium inversicolor]